MEMMRRLHEASIEGNVIVLLELLQEDPLILDRQISSCSCYTETALHIAAMLGHVEFAKEILSRKRYLAGERDSPQNSAPLHLAAAKGCVKTVQALLLANSEMCLASDGNGRNPLHIAAIKGRIDVLKELVGQASPQAVRDRVMADQGNTILHLCVQHNQLEALKFLVETITKEGDHEFLNSKDDDGNTILHVAVADKQIETIKFLISNTANTRVEVNAQNANGYTALDILAQSRKDVSDMVICESLQLVGTLKAKDLISSARHEFRQIRSREDPHSEQVVALDHKKIDKNTWETSLKKQDNWLVEHRNSLMVVASLLAAMAFQAGVNPPGGVWQDTQDAGQNSHTAGYSIMAYNNSNIFNQFILCNTSCCITSLSIILLLISGLPIRRRIFMWILMVIMWIAITSAAMAYAFSLEAITPLDDDQDKPPEYGGQGVVATTCAIVAWVGVMCLLLLGHTLRLIWKMIRGFIRFVRRRRHRGRSNSMINNRGSV